jgi:hypothetical protein
MKVIDNGTSPVIILITKFNITFTLREEGLNEGDYPLFQSCYKT